MTLTSTYSLQQAVINQVKSKLKPGISLVDEIAEILNISNDSAYRRIRCEKDLSLSELQKLSMHYRLSLDKLIDHQSKGVLFFGDWIGSEGYDFQKYLETLLAQFRQISKAPSAVIYYEAKDILPFHHFQFDELAAFKYFFWMKTILQHPEFNKMHFEDVVIDPVTHETGLNIIKAYSTISSIEIWNHENLYSSIRQIQYYEDSGVFRKKETAGMLYLKLGELVTHLEEQAESGKKFIHGSHPENAGNFQLFYNETFFGHNTILLEIDQVRHAYINHGVLNYMETTDNRFCDYVKRSMENTIRKSCLISRVNEKERQKFFSAMREQLPK
jgi:hypothetical protein